MKRSRFNAAANDLLMVAFFLDPFLGPFFVTPFFGHFFDIFLKIFLIRYSIDWEARLGGADAIF